MRQNIFIGFYFSLGDLICAHRALTTFAERNADSQVYIGVSKGTESAKEIFQWPENVEFMRFVLPRLGTLKASFDFLKEFCGRRYFRVINSPLAPLQRVSWKIPIFMKLMEWLGYAETTEGPTQDPFSFLYKKAWPISRDIPLPRRDQIFFELINSGSQIVEQQALPPASGSAFNISLPARDAIGIHVGASLANRRWPAKNTVKLCWLIRSRFAGTEIDLLGLENELLEIKAQKLPENTNIVASSFTDVVARVTSLRGIVTMDSGFMHVASVAGIPQVAIFGPSSIKPHFPDNPRAIASHRQVLSCQPCDRLKCRFEQNYCMQLVTPEQVMADLEHVLALP